MSISALIVSFVDLVIVKTPTRVSRFQRVCLELSFYSHCYVHWRLGRVFAGWCEIVLAYQGCLCSSCILTTLATQ